MSTSAVERIHREPGLQAHWARRIAAGVIDWLLVMIPVVFVSEFVKILPGLFPKYISSVFISGVLWFLYGALLEASTMHSTIGKLALRLRVVRVKGGDPTLVETTMRNVSRIFGLFLLADLLIGFVTEGDPRQRLLDRTSGTLVIMEGE